MGRAAAKKAQGSFAIVAGGRGAAQDPAQAMKQSLAMAVVGRKAGVLSLGRGNHEGDVGR